MSKIQDGYAAELAASDNVTEDNIFDLVTEGQTSVPIPEGIDLEDYKVSVVDFIKEVWGEPEVNFTYRDAEFETEEDGDVLLIKVV